LQEQKAAMLIGPNGRNASQYFWSEANMNSTPMGRYLTRREWGFIQEAFQRHGFPELVLDVGGGDGRFAVRLSMLGIQTTILEHDPVPIRELVARGWSEPVVLGDGNCLPCKDDSFDAIMAIETPCTASSHLAGFLAGSHQVLKPKGLILLTTHNAVSMIGIQRLWCASKYRTTSGTYAHSFWTVRRALVHGGFDLLESRGFRWILGSRKSRSRLIPLWGYLEHVLFLERLPHVAPWIFWVARKK